MISRLKMPTAAACLLLTAGSMFAASMAVSPVRIELSRKRPTSTIMVENQSESERMYQLETVAWSQKDGQDAYQNTGELIAVPPVFTLKPGHKQVIRLGTKASFGINERAFRLFIRELPEENKTDGESSTQSVKTLLRVGVPVFLAGEQAFSQNDVEFRVEGSGGGITAIRAKNSNSSHVQVGRMQLANGEVIQAAFYLLPGEARRWQLPAPLRVEGKEFDLTVDTDRGKIVTRAVVE